MILKVINSGSSGNCYILIANNGDCLILEAGVRLLDVKEALKFDISGIVGCCSTHCHLDHSEYLLQYAKSSIKCYSGEETINKFEKHHNLIAIKPNVKIQLGSFSTMPFLLHHDVVPLLTDHDQAVSWLEQPSPQLALAAL